MNTLLKQLCCVKFACAAIALLYMSACAVLPQAPSGESPERALEMLARGVGYMRSGMLDDAEVAFELANKLAPGLVEGYDGLGCVAFRRGDMNKSRKHFKRAIAIDSSYAPAWAHMALVAERDGESRSAEILYREAIRLMPQNGQVRNNYGVFLLESNVSYSEARRELLFARELLRDNKIIVEKNLRNLANQK